MLCTHSYVREKAKIRAPSTYFVRVYSPPMWFNANTSTSILQSNEPYKNLENAISINTENVWSGFQAFSIPIGFNFQYMDSTFTSASLEATGSVIFDEKHFSYADLLIG